MPSEQVRTRHDESSTGLALKPILSRNQFYSRFATLNPAINKIAHTARNRKNRNFAISAVAEAIPVKPQTAAITANYQKYNSPTQHNNSPFLCVFVCPHAFARPGL